jgi:endogenous inhibitor of DNA gyrase (YacG/DUF329 family)
MIDGRAGLYIIIVTMRTKPVQREEIRCSWAIETMPANSLRKGDNGDLESIAELWAPLLRTLDQERKALWEDWVQRGVDRADNPPEPIKVPRPYHRSVCRHCGRAFYKADKGSRRNGGAPLYCSDKCVAAVHALAMAPIVKARSKARATIRADRKCATCGKPIKAKRSTMKFCSVKCRVAAHRAGDREIETKEKPSHRDDVREARHRY